MWPIGCFYDFLPLTGLFPKVVLIHKRLFELVIVDFSIFKSVEVNFCILSFYGFGA